MSQSGPRGGEVAEHLVDGLAIKPEPQTEAVRTPANLETPVYRHERLRHFRAADFQRLVENAAP